jgi:2-C-methyl-D-erythritol 2,4-cyclodiphosphate synthase
VSTASSQLPFRIGHGFDVHRLVEGRKLIIGGIHVPHLTGALGHSDADVLAHAIADSILGAAALGELGTLFPDTDAQYRDANSLDLLSIALAHVHGAGYKVGNIDATVVVQAPRLAPYVPMMRGRMAETLGIEREQMSIKIKSSEKLGYTGDGSGIAAYSVALLTKIDADA